MDMTITKSVENRAASIKDVLNVAKKMNDSTRDRFFYLGYGLMLAGDQDDRCKRNNTDTN